MLSCKDHIEELQPDKNKIPFVGHPRSCFFVFWGLVFFSTGCLLQDPVATEEVCFSGSPSFLEFLLSKSGFHGCSKGKLPEFPRETCFSGFSLPLRILYTVLHSSAFFLCFSLYYYNYYFFYCLCSSLLITVFQICPTAILLMVERGGYYV